MGWVPITDRSWILGPLQFKCETLVTHLTHLVEFLHCYSPYCQISEGLHEGGDPWKHVKFNLHKTSFLPRGTTYTCCLGLPSRQYWVHLHFSNILCFKELPLWLFNIISIVLNHWNSKVHLRHPTAAFAWTQCHSNQTETLNPTPLPTHPPGYP